MSKTDWYDKFIDEVHELEGVIKCDKCGSDDSYHSDPFGYTFLCGKCGNIFEYQNGKYKDEIATKFSNNDFDENGLDINTEK